MNNVLDRRIGLIRVCVCVYMSVSKINWNKGYTYFFEAVKNRSVRFCVYVWVCVCEFQCVQFDHLHQGLAWLTPLNKCVKNVLLSLLWLWLRWAFIFSVVKDKIGWKHIFPENHGDRHFNSTMCILERVKLTMKTMMMMTTTTS